MQQQLGSRAASDDAVVDGWDEFGDEIGWRVPDIESTRL